MRRALLIIVVGLLGPAVAHAQSDRPLRDLFGPPARTLKQAIQGEKPWLDGSETAPAAAASSPDDEGGQPATAAEAIEILVVPTPRLRPAAVASRQDPEPLALMHPDEGRKVLSYPPEEPVQAATITAPAPEPEPTVADPAPTERVGRLNEPVAPELPDAADDSLAEIPLPRPRGTPPPPGTRVASLPSDPEKLTGGSCKARLTSIGAVAVTAPRISQGACGIQQPIKVSGLGDGVTLTQTATLNCETAEALADFTREVIDPAARQYLNGRLTGLRIAASYSCRSRNSVKGARLSEHASGNAVDISAFRIDGVGWVVVGQAKNLGARRFMAAVRKAACGPFKTVLGPGSDGYHKDHLHFDLAKRRNGSTYCR